MAASIRAIFKQCVACDNPTLFFCRYSAILYKILQATDPVFDLMEEVARSSHASGPTVSGIANGRKRVKLLGDILSSFYLLTVVIPALLYAPYTMARLLKGIKTDERISIKIKLTGHDEVISKKEKIACLAALIARFIKGIIALIIFCMAFFPERSTQLYLKVCKHGSGIVLNLLEINYQHAKYERSFMEGVGSEEAYQLYANKMFEQALGLTENMLKLLYDIAKLLQRTPPPWFRLPIAFLISGIGIYRVCLKTL
jgi:hypothetical protein